jgi:uncharacterized membrane protein
MIHIFHDICHSLSQPAQRHAMLVHMPIMMSMIALACLVMLSLSRGRSSGWRRTTLVVLILGMLSVKLAQNAGDAAAGQLNYPLTEQATALLDLHEHMADGLFWFFLVTAALTAITFFKRFWLRWPATGLALLAGVVLILRVAMVAHAGGLLVYEQGVGVPSNAANNVSHTATVP